MKAISLLLSSILIANLAGVSLDQKWIVICGSYERKADAERRLASLERAGHAGFQVATSSHYKGLKANLWILVHSVTTNKATALAAVRELKSNKIDAYAKTYTAFVAAPETLPADFFPASQGRATTRPKPEQPLSAAEVYERTSNSVVTVLTDSKQGTGFVIRKEAVLTCFHVVKDAKSITIRFPNGTILQAVLDQWDKSTDIALLVPERSLSSKPLVSDRLKNLYFDIDSPGEKVFVIGSPKGLELSISEGIVSAQRWLPWDDAPPGSAIKNFELIQISAPVSAGSSGSPVFNRFGRVIGIVVAKFTDSEGIGFAVDISMARVFIP